MATNPFFLGYSEPELLELQASYKAAVAALATSASYEIVSGNSSRKLTRGNLDAIKETLGQINEAIEELRGNDTRVTYADFRGGSL